jgi:hypothetical protein
MDSYLIAGLALRFPSLLDYEARQLAEVIPAADEADALAEACRRLLTSAPPVEGWEGHTVRATPLRPLAAAG